MQFNKTRCNIALFKHSLAINPDVVKYNHHKNYLSLEVVNVIAIMECDMIAMNANGTYCVVLDEVVKQVYY